MKNLILLALVIFLFSFSFATVFEGGKPKEGMISIKYSFINGSPGIIHTTKTVVYINDKMIAESQPHPDNQPGVVSFRYPKGEYKIRIVNLTLTEGVWEEHTREYDFTVDFRYLSEIKLQKRLIITLLFDFASGTTAMKSLK